MFLSVCMPAACKVNALGGIASFRMAECPKVVRPDSAWARASYLWIFPSRFKRNQGLQMEPARVAWT
jgi:hypothetical protein